VLVGKGAFAGGMNLAEADVLARLLADGGVVSASELLDAGVPMYLVRKHLKRTWSALVEGVYVVDGRVVDDDVKARMTAKVGGPGTVISGSLAARWLELPWIPVLPTVLGLIPAERRRRSRRFVVLRRTKALSTVRTFDREGMSVADVPWAVLDTAYEISRQRKAGDASKLRDVRGVVLGAIGAGRVAIDELTQVLGMSTIAHSGLARRALVDAQRGAVSPPEAECIDDLLTYGIPFVANVEVWVQGRFLGIVDIWLVGTGVGIEQDSKQEHQEAGRLDRTLLRSKGFDTSGAVLHHVTPTRYRSDPHRFLGRVFADVRRRQVLGLGDPPGIELRNPRGPVLQGDGAVPYALSPAEEQLPRTD
jgi:hypothetical protein